MADLFNDVTIGTLSAGTLSAGTLSAGTLSVSAGATIGAITVGGTASIGGAAAIAGAITVGGASIPLRSSSADTVAVAGDANGGLLHPSADTTPRTFTIPANASVSYDAGTAISFVNQVSAGVLTIAINSDTLRFAGAGTTGSRTLIADGIATALKVTSTEWIISGVGLT